VVSKFYETRRAAGQGRVVESVGLAFGGAYAVTALRSSMRPLFSMK
jgi:hypothetical protein